MEKVKWLIKGNTPSKEIKDVVFLRDFDIYDSFNFASLFFSSNAYVQVSINEYSFELGNEACDISKYLRLDLTKYLRTGKNELAFKITAFDLSFIQEYMLNYELRIIMSDGQISLITPSNDDYGYYGNGSSRFGIGYFKGLDAGKYFDLEVINGLKPENEYFPKPLKRYKGEVIETGEDYMVYDFHDFSLGYPSASYRGICGSTVKFEYLDNERRLISYDLITLSGDGDEKYSPLWINRIFRYLKVTFSDETVTVFMNLLKNE